jgi:hypothetical protein
LTAGPVTTSVPAARRPVSMREYLSESRAVMLAIAVAVFGMFLPTVIVPYAYSDDYVTLSTANGLWSSPVFGKSVLDAAAVNGRPLQGLGLTLFFSAAGTIDNLRFVRLFAVIVIVALALLLHWALVRAGVGRISAALIAVLVCSLPAFQVSASWAVLFLSPSAALLGGVASVLTVAAVDAPRNLMADRLVGATATLLGALLIYQPGAMFFWVFLAIALVGATQQSGRALRLVRTHFGVAAVALALAYLMVKLGAHLFGDTASNVVRNSLTHDVIGKVRWFFKEPLYGSLNLFALTPSPWLAGFVAVVATVGIVLLLWYRRVRPLPYVGIAVVLIPLTYLPNLVVHENSATFRTRLSISSLIALYACLGAFGIWLTLRDWLKPRVSGHTLRAAERVALAMSVAFVATSAFFASKNVTTLFVEPQITELRMVRSQVAAFPAGVPRVAFVTTGYREGMTNLALYDEFGVPSSWQFFTEEPLVLLVLREEGRLARNGPKPIVDVVRWPATTPPTDEPTVDVRGLQRLR